MMFFLLETSLSCFLAICSKLLKHLSTFKIAIAYRLQLTYLIVCFLQIIIAYKSLIRDVHLSLKASTNSEAESFVDNLFGFERRIVAAMKVSLRELLFGSLSIYFLIFSQQDKKVRYQKSIDFMMLRHEHIRCR